MKILTSLNVKTDISKLGVSEVDSHPTSRPLVDISFISNYVKTHIN